jgi:predicted PurR-regulated permease PerM
MAANSRGTITLQMLLALACMVVILVGLKSAKVVFVPVLLAAFLALIGQAPFAWLRERGFPAALAASIVALVTAGTLTGIGAGFAYSLSEFRTELPRYREQMDGLIQSALKELSELGIELPPEPFQLLEGEQWIGLTSQAMGNLLQATSFAILVLAFVFFVLFEFSEFREKLRRLAREFSFSLQTFPSPSSGQSLPCSSTTYRFSVPW